MNQTTISRRNTGGQIIACQNNNRYDSRDGQEKRLDMSFNRDQLLQMSSRELLIALTGKDGSSHVDR